MPRTRRQRPALDASAAGLIVLLVAAVATDEFSLPVSGFNFRVELLIGGAVALAALLMTRQQALHGWGLVDLCLGGWLIVNLVSSLAFSPAPLKSLKFVVLLAGLLTIYVAARLLIRSDVALVWGAVAFAVLGSAVVLLGLVCALLFSVIGPNFGIFLERLYRDKVFVVIPRVRSVLWEPNIFGSFSLLVCTLASALVMGQRPARYSVLRPPSIVPQLAIAAGMCGVVLSMTRTVWAVGPPVILLMTVIARRLGLADLRRIAVTILVPALLGGVAGLGVGLSLPILEWSMPRPWEPSPEQLDGMVREKLNSPPSSSAIHDRIEELRNVRQAASVTPRWRISKSAFEGWWRHPILGWGAGAFPLVYPYSPDGGYWIANVTLHILFDTGIVGLLLFVTGVGVAWWRALSTIRYSPSQWDAASYVTFGLLSSGVGLLAAFQLTDGTWLGFVWVLLGMLVAAGER